MSYARKNAIVTAAIWAFVLVAVTATVLIPGPEMFGAPEYRLWRLIAAAVILPGFVVNAWLGWRTKRGKERGEMDERDEAIARRASQGTLIVVAMLVYFASIILYEGYNDTGMVPVGWMWLLAYGSVAVVSLVHAVATLVVDVTGMADA